MNHSFDIEIAKKCGVNAAIIYENITHWLRHNLANEINIRDGRPWTYNSVTAFCRIFPYLTKDQIRRALEILLKNGLIIKGEYNQHSYDRTLWYSVPDLAVLKISKAEDISKNDSPIWHECQMDLASVPNGFGNNAKLTWQKNQMDLAKKPNGFGTGAKPIPIINKNINTNINTVINDSVNAHEKQKNKTEKNKNEKETLNQNQFFEKQQTNQEQETKSDFENQKANFLDLLEKLMQKTKFVGEPW